MGRKVGSGLMHCSHRFDSLIAFLFLTESVLSALCRLFMVFLQPPLAIACHMPLHALTSAHDKYVHGWTSLSLCVRILVGLFQPQGAMYVINLFPFSCSASTECMGVWMGMGGGGGVFNDFGWV